MQYTNHYNLNLPEGTDIVNPLVQDNPNYTAIDTALYNNKVRVVGNASEVKSGTVHAITRSDSDIDVIRFTATGDWVTGDTMTVDGTPVTVYLQDGIAPLTGAYVINTEVLAILSGTRVTLYAAQQLPPYAASDVTYDNTQSGLPATNVQDAIDEVVTMIPPLPPASVNTFNDARIDITAYNTSSNLYIFPEDGYVNTGAYNNGRADCNIYGSNGVVGGHLIQLITTAGAGQFQSDAVFVRKGMCCFCSNVSAGVGNAVYYQPLS